jgi:hypothetical protein
MVVYVDKRAGVPTRTTHRVHTTQQVYTVNHHKDGELRLDVTITYRPGGEDVIYAHTHEDFDHEKWFAARTPVGVGRVGGWVAG